MLFPILRSYTLFSLYPYHRIRKHAPPSPPTLSLFILYLYYQYYYQGHMINIVGIIIITARSWACHRQHHFSWHREWKPRKECKAHAHVLLACVQKGALSVYTHACTHVITYLLRLIDDRLIKTNDLSLHWKPGLCALYRTPGYMEATGWYIFKSDFFHESRCLGQDTWFGFRVWARTSMCMGLIYHCA